MDITYSRPRRPRLRVKRVRYEIFSLAFLLICLIVNRASVWWSLSKRDASFAAVHVDQQQPSVTAARSLMQAAYVPALPSTYVGLGVVPLPITDPDSVVKLQQASLLKQPSPIMPEWKGTKNADKKCRNAHEPCFKVAAPPGTFFGAIEGVSSSVAVAKDSYYMLQVAITCQAVKAKAHVNIADSTTKTLLHPVRYFHGTEESSIFFHTLGSTDRIDMGLLISLPASGDECTAQKWTLTYMAPARKFVPPPSLRLQGTNVSVSLASTPRRQYELVNTINSLYPFVDVFQVRVCQGQGHFAHFCRQAVVTCAPTHPLFHITT